MDHGALNVIQLVCKHVDINGRDMYGRTALKNARLRKKVAETTVDDNIARENEIALMTDIIRVLQMNGAKGRRDMTCLERLKQYTVVLFAFISAILYLLYEKIVLLGVYVVSTERADIQHFIYLIFFLIFIVGPNKCRKYWWLFTLYSGLQITVRYIANIVCKNYTCTDESSITDDIGILPPSYISGLLYPVILMSFTIIQYYLNKNRKDEESLRGFTLEHFVLKNASQRVNSFIYAIVYYIFFIIEDWGLIIVYIGLIIVGLSDVHCMNLGYVFSVFLCWFIHSWFRRVWSILRKLWWIVVLYTAASFFGLYACQYEFIYNFLNQIYPNNLSKYLSLSDIGLKDGSSDQDSDEFAMFLIMLGPMFALVLSLIQFTYLMKSHNYDNIHTKEQLFHLEVRNNIYVNKISRFFSNILYMGKLHMSKGLLIAVFAWSVARPNLISYGYTVILCLCLINRTTLHTGWMPFQFYSIIIFVIRYLYQLHYFGNNLNGNKARETAHVIGFNRWGTSNGDNPVDATIGDIMSGCGQELTILVLTTVQVILQTWIVKANVTKFKSNPDQFKWIKNCLTAIYMKFKSQGDQLSKVFNKFTLNNITDYDVFQYSSSDELKDCISDDKVRAAFWNRLLIFRDPHIEWTYERIYFEDHEMEPTKLKQKGSMQLILEDSVSKDNKQKKKQNTKAQMKKYKSFKLRQNDRRMSYQYISVSMQFIDVNLNVIMKFFWRTMRRIWYFVTHCFQIFGTEICIMLLMFCAFYRRNSAGIIYVIVILGFYVHHSRYNYITDNCIIKCMDFFKLGRIWPVLFVFMAVWLLLQYWWRLPEELVCLYYPRFLPYMFIIINHVYIGRKRSYW